MDARTMVAMSLLVVAACASDRATVRSTGRTEEQRFFDWTEMRFDAEVYAARRAQLAERIAADSGGVFLTASHDGSTVGGTFRQLDDFLYFTGLELPGSVLAIESDGGVSLFTPPRDGRFESTSRPNDFPGRPLGDDPELAQRTGLERIRPIEQWRTALTDWAADGRTLWLNGGRAGLEKPEPDWPTGRGPEEALAEVVRSAAAGSQIRDAFGHVAHLRMVKGPEEVAVIRRAVEITCDSILESARHVRPGVDERTLEAELEAGYKRRGSQRRAFDSIIKSGPNSLWPWRVLAAHYDRRNRAMQAGELVIYDVGCELDHYASDVGRTFPVSGRFSAEQREIMEMEIAVADAILAAVRPGVTLHELQAIAEAATPAEQRQYMQTGLFFGHHIGLDVGDPSLADVPLEAGMVFTIEPWYYNHDLGIAVFTEDDVLVTESGVENLSASLPRTPEALERLVGGP